MLYAEIISVYCDSHSHCMNILCGQNQSFNVTSGNHSAIQFDITLIHYIFVCLLVKAISPAIGCNGNLFISSIYSHIQKVLQCTVCVCVCVCVCVSFDEVGHHIIDASWNTKLRAVCYGSYEIRCHSLH